MKIMASVIVTAMLVTNTMDGKGVIMKDGDFFRACMIMIMMMMMIFRDTQATFLYWPLLLLRKPLCQRYTT